MERLIKEAQIARTRAYIPYSKFGVGAAVLLKDGTIIHGANIENVSYGLTNCAERSALFSLYSKGYQKEDIVAMAVTAHTKDPISPCGACRQVMRELMDEKTPIYLSNLEGKVKIVTIKDLLPYSFNEVENV